MFCDLFLYFQLKVNKRISYSWINTIVLLLHHWRKRKTVKLVTLPQTALLFFFHNESMKISLTDHFVPAHSNLDPLTILMYCSIYTCKVDNTRTFLSMATAPERVGHEFGEQRCKIYVREELEELKKCEWRLVYKRMIRNHLEHYCPIWRRRLLKL